MPRSAAQRTAFSLGLFGQGVEVTAVDAGSVRQLTRGSIRAEGSRENGPQQGSARGGPGEQEDALARAGGHDFTLLFAHVIDAR
jgi:hypothetical protein